MVTYHLHEKGIKAEEAAYQYLKQQGLLLITKNFRNRIGEIDLIMQDYDDIVFVEVRSRSRPDYTNALESIDEGKIRKLTATATLFLQQKGWLEKKTGRFDVVAIDIINNTMHFNWVKNAF